MLPDYVKNFLNYLVIAIVGWAFRLESNVRTLDKNLAVMETKQVDLKELINTRFDASDERLGRIERSLNGKLVK